MEKLDLALPRNEHQPEQDKRWVLVQRSALVFKR